MKIKSPEYTWKMNVAHIVLFERESWKVLIQFNNRFNAFSFIWGKCEWKSNEDTIIEETFDETWYTIQKEEFVEVLKNSKVVWKILCNWTIFTWYLPKWFKAIDKNWEWKANFKNIDEIDYENFITKDIKEDIINVIEKCRIEALKTLK